MTADDVVRKASDAAFGRPLEVNHFRSQLVEAMVAEALTPEWQWVSGDWAGWDFQSSAGDKLEVKQSARRQTWSSGCQKSTRSSFDIAARTGYWIGENWVNRPGRNAGLYVFAYHPVVDQTADHRDPHQWDFYVVHEAQLPPAPQKTIGLTMLPRLARATKITDLMDQVSEVLSNSKQQ